MYFDLIKLCLCVALNIPIKLCMFRHGNNVYFELTIPSFYIGHDMRNCFTCTRQTKVAQGTPHQRMPPNRFPETHFGLFYIQHGAIVPIVCFCKCDRKTHHPEKSLIGEPLVLLNGRENTEDKADKHRHEPSRKRTTIMINIINQDSNQYVKYMFATKARVDKIDLLYFDFPPG